MHRNACRNAGRGTPLWQMGQAELFGHRSLTKKRMETVDEEFLAATMDLIDRANRDKKPFLAVV
jgi:hypothetical protein